MIKNNIEDVFKYHTIIPEILKQENYPSDTAFSNVKKPETYEDYKMLDIFNKYILHFVIKLWNRLNQNHDCLKIVEIFFQILKKDEYKIMLLAYFIFNIENINVRTIEGAFGRMQKDIDINFEQLKELFLY